MKNYTIIFTIANDMHKPLWPEIAPAGPRSGPNPFTACFRWGRVRLFGAAAQPSGSKLPRHGELGNMGKLY